MPVIAPDLDVELAQRFEKYSSRLLPSAHKSDVCAITLSLHLSEYNRVMAIWSVAVWHIADVHNAQTFQLGNVETLSGENMIITRGRCHHKWFCVQWIKVVFVVKMNNGRRRA